MPCGNLMLAIRVLQRSKCKKIIDIATNPIQNQSLDDAVILAMYIAAGLSGTQLLVLKQIIDSGAAPWIKLLLDDVLPVLSANPALLVFVPELGPYRKLN